MHRKSSDLRKCLIISIYMDFLRFCFPFFCIRWLMVYHYANDSCCMSLKDDIPYKCVVYVDTTDCSFCMLKRLQLWNDYMPYEDAGKISLIFIVSSRKNEANSLIRQLKHISLRHDVYVDTCQYFMNKNSFFPKEKMFHTLLMCLISTFLL